MNNDNEERTTVLRMKINDMSDDETAEPDLGAVDEEVVFRCSDCRATFVKKNNLVTHRRAFHSQMCKKYVCEECSKEFRFKSNYKAHKNIHLDLPRCYKCDFCSSGFKTPRALKNHLKTHETIKNFICEVCGKKFTTTMNLKNHMLAHSENRPHFCEICYSSFKRRSHLHQHQKDVHGVIHGDVKGDFFCGFCPRVFTTLERLELHMRKHTGDLPFSCEICWRHFASQLGLKVHQSMGECGTKPSSCSQCAQVYAPGEEPCVHIKYKVERPSGYRNERVKTNKVARKDLPRNYKCEVCNKAFIFACDKRTHFRVCHTNERPFTCETCGKAFKAKNTLQNHQAVHIDLRPHPCMICEKRFRRPEQLTLHIRTHTGEKPYLCPECGRGFAQLGDMKKHRKIHERGN